VTLGDDAGRARGRVAGVCRLLWNGGVQRVAIAQIEGLRNRGWIADLFFLRATGDASYTLPDRSHILLNEEPERRGPVAALSQRITRLFAAHRGEHATVDLDLLWKLRERLDEYDVTIFNDQYGAILGIYRRLTRGRTYVTMFHEFYPKVARRASRRVLYPLADLLDAVSILIAPVIVTTSQRTFDRLARIVPGKVLLARIGCDIAPARPAIENRDRRQVASITVWDEGRHPELYLEVARRLPQFTFVLAGGWADEEHFRRFHADAGAVSNLRITGPISEAERLHLLGSSLVYLRLGFGESGPGMGGLEALGQGSIIVANAGLGISEILTDGTDGFVTEGDTPEAVARTVERIDRMSLEELDQLSRAAYALAERHSWAAHNAIVEQALRMALDTGARLPNRTTSRWTVADQEGRS
jgi:glycosyltransferase involved in cell wall biosynthesis